MKLKLIILVLIIGCLKSYAQQTTLFNTYSYDLMQLNIASIGRTCFEANLNYRTQWLGVKETPKFYQLNAALSVGKNSGFGVKVSQQTMGLLKLTNATLGYAYKVKLNEKSKLHLGLGAAWQQNSFTADKAIVVDKADLSIGTNAAQQRSNNFDVEAGALFLGDKLTAGISALHLYNTNSKLDVATYKLSPNLNAIIAYKFNKGKSVEVEPWLVNRFDVKGKNQTEALLNFKFKQAIIIGAGYRLNYGYLALAGFEVGKFKIAYSFDYGSGANANTLGSSHQVLLGFDLCKAKKAKKPEPIVVKEEPKIEPFKEEPKKEEKIEIKEEPKIEPIKEEPKVDLEAERLKKEEAAFKEMNNLCEALEFDVNKTTLPLSKAPQLDAIAKLIKENNFKVKIKGFASKDGNPVRNATLSVMRANFVQNELIKRGVKVSNVKHEGVGDTEELFDNNSALKGKNRTVRISSTK
jgi:type IX secretion system PorP/SprF family membrane protein